jgi:hypothetical protein
MRKLLGTVAAVLLLVLGGLWAVSEQMTGVTFPV